MFSLKVKQMATYALSMCILSCIVSASLLSQRIAATIGLPSGSKPTQICVDEQSNKVYVSDYSNARIFEIDGVAKTVARIFSVPIGPTECIVNPMKKKLYAYCSNEGSSKYFSVIDLTTGDVDSIYTHSGYYGILTNFVIHPSLDKVYFLDVWDLCVYNGATNTLSKVKNTQFGGPLYVEQIGMDTVMNRVYVPNGGGNVMVVDCATDSVINTLTVDPSSYARTSVATVNQSKSLLFVAAWSYQYDKIFSTKDNQFLSPQIDELSTDNWQTSIHEQLNIACRSHEIDQRSDIVDLERHTSKLISFNQGCDGRLVAINQNSARAFFVYADSTVAFDLLNGTKKVFAVGKGYETISFSLRLGSFNQSTEELYIPNRVTGTVSVIKDTVYSGIPAFLYISIIQGTHSLVVKGSRFGVLQGSSTVTINGVDVGTATYWSPDSMYFENNSHVVPGNIVVNVLGRTASEFVLPVELISFDAEAKATGIVLHWTTATEVNNYGFDVERRVLGKTEWKKIGFIPGNGTSNIQHQYSFTDHSLMSGSYAYRLKQIDINGMFKYSQEAEVVNHMPQEFTLYQNYPNPFNPTTSITFALPEKSFVSLKVIDLVGREISKLISEEMLAGRYLIQWNAADIPSGVYFYRLQSGLNVATKKLVILK